MTPQATIPVLYVTVASAKPLVLRTVGVNPDRRDMVYFDRKYSVRVDRDQKMKGFQGVDTLEFPLPLLLGDQVKVVVTDFADGSGKNVAILKQYTKREAVVGLDVDQESIEFIQFAAHFALHCGAMSENQYYSKQRNYMIWLRNQMRSHETGKIVHTPARVNHKTGHVEVSKEDFLPLTVVNRFMILCHEHYHIIGKTQDEFACDRFAINACLRLGFSGTECLYSLYRLFKIDRPGTPAASRKERENRVARARDMITVFQSKHG